MTTPSTNSGETRLNENDFPVWKETFCDTTRREMVDEDMRAGHYVPMLLVGCAAAGLVLGALGVWLTA